MQLNVHLRACTERVLEAVNRPQGTLTLTVA